MDWKAFVAAFSAIFLAEMGDKTQLLVLSLSSQRKAYFSVWLGATLALAIATGLGVIAADLINRVLPENIIRWFAGSLLILFGILVFLDKF